jgi:hypothetical protein
MGTEPVASIIANNTIKVLTISRKLILNISAIGVEVRCLSNEQEQTSFVDKNTKLGCYIKAKKIIYLSLYQWALAQNSWSVQSLDI